MSTYDKVSLEMNNIKQRRCIFNGMIGCLITFFVYESSTTFSTTFKVLSFLPLLFFCSMIIHIIRQNTSKTYYRESQKLAELQQRAHGIRVKVENIFRRYPSRAKGAQFKKTFELTGKNIRELEEALAIGMAKEGKEIFVTAFMRAGIAVRVTASIGSVYQCSAADNPSRWSDYIEKFGCDEIRQYHNHPTTANRTAPSSLDYKTTKYLKNVLGRHSNKMRSFIIYWNEIREWRILEYDEAPPCNLIYAFDAAV